MRDITFSLSGPKTDSPSLPLSNISPLICLNSMFLLELELKLTKNEGNNRLKRNTMLKKMRLEKKEERKFQPAQVLIASFLISIFVGTMLLLLPLSSKSGHISFIDALFTATSAICVTGLTVRETATYFSTFGQIVLLTLIQLGGLGIMTFSTLILFVAGKKISIKDRLILQEGFHPSYPYEVKALIKKVVLYFLVIEAFGFLSLFLSFYSNFPLPQAIFNSLFHSVSAFCNAGFSLFSTSLVSYHGHIGVNLTIIILIVLGGLGFLVLDEISKIKKFFSKKEKKKASLHTKLVLRMTSFLILFPFLLFLALEWGHSLKGFSLKNKIIISLFQVITPRTAGFNTIDLNTLSFATIFLLIMLMFVGASPGSTGGGVKTITIGVIFAFLKAKIAARESISIYQRSLPFETITKAYTIVTLSLLIIFLNSFLLLLLHPWASISMVIFEVFSAFGTVGLSLGMTPKLCVLGKIVIILTMYIGRIGALTLLYALSRATPFGKYAYVEENVMIG